MALNRCLNLALILDTSLVCFTVVAAAGRLYFCRCIFIHHSHIGCIVELLLKDRLRLNSLKFRSEIGEALGAAIRTTPSIGEGIATVLRFIPGAAPDSEVWVRLTVLVSRIHLMLTNYLFRLHPS